MLDLIPELVELILLNLNLHVILTGDVRQLLYPHAHLLDVLQLFEGLLVNDRFVLFSQVAVEIGMPVCFELF